jgi:cytoskeleton protein RodZ
VEPLNHNNEGRETGEEVSLGRLLKRSREERQIELDEVFSVTRIRRHTLEALENELWDELPSQVFVKGFLKTYAEFLGLDKERAIELYERISPHEGGKSELLKQVSPRGKGQTLKVILPLVALALIATLMFFRREDISVEDKGSQRLEVREHVEEEREAALQEEMGDQAEEDKPETLIRPEPVEERDLTEVNQIDQQMNEKPLPPQFSLTAIVRSRTWMAIFVDDQPVKEYLFQPGETFTWNAHKGFDILVGNAGGINFILNGAEIGTLGAEGKVVRVKLPKTED